MARILRWFLRLLAAAALLVLVALAVIGWKGAGHLVSPPRRSLQDYHREILARPAHFGLQIEDFTLHDSTPCLLVTASQEPGEAEKSRILRHVLEQRGVDLPPWGAQLGTIIMFNGHGGRKEDHLPICERFCAAGFRCLLIELPAHGDHPASIGTFGRRESTLAEKALAAASAEFAFDPRPACLFGVSQGGAIALQTAALAPSSWTAVASISTFASLDRPIRTATRDRIPGTWSSLRPAVHLSITCATWIRGGFLPSAVRPVDAATRLDLPTMIVHGDQDSSIGIDQAEEIYQAIPSPEKHFRPVVGANHSRVLATGSHELYADLCQFFLQACR